MEYAIFISFEKNTFRTRKSFRRSVHRRGRWLRPRRHRSPHRCSVSLDGRLGQRHAFCMDRRASKVACTSPSCWSPVGYISVRSCLHHQVLHRHRRAAFVTFGGRSRSSSGAFVQYQRTVSARDKQNRAYAGPKKGLACDK